MSVCFVLCSFGVGVEFCLLLLLLLCFVCVFCCLCVNSCLSFLFVFERCRGNANVLMQSRLHDLAPAAMSPSLWVGDGPPRRGQSIAVVLGSSLKGLFREMN